MHDAPVTGVELRLVPASVSEEITVTANPGSAEGIGAVPQQVNVIDEDEIALRAKTVVAQVGERRGGPPPAAHQPDHGRHLRARPHRQQGQRLRRRRALLDRRPQRGGVSTFLDLDRPGRPRRRSRCCAGPSSAQYGSDALGGSVQFLTAPARASSAERRASCAAAYGARLRQRRRGLRLAPDRRVLRRRASRVARHARRPARQHAAAGRRHRLAQRGDALPRPPSDLVLDDGRLPDTAFTQYGGRCRRSWALDAATAARRRATARSQQDGGKRYDQLLGGDGNLIADLRNLMLDLAHVRVRALGARLRSTTLTLGYSFNAPARGARQPGRQRQPARRRSTTSPSGRPCTACRARSASAVGRARADARRRRLLRAGRRRRRSPSTRSTERHDRAPRPRARRRALRQGGVFVQDVFEAVPTRLRR